MDCVWVQPEAAAKPAAAAETTEEKSVEWGIFKLRSCQAMVLYWIACGNVYMNMAQVTTLT